MVKPLIMVVDDEKEVADATARLVSLTDKYETVTAYSAEEAMEIIKKNKIWFGLAPRPNRVELILLDIKMPGMDGLQFLGKLRERYPEEKIGVILITAFEDAEKWDKATDEFVAGYLNKPFEEKELLAMLGRFFSRKEERLEMVMDTFEKHIDKMKDGFNQEKPETSK